MEFQFKLIYASLLLLLTACEGRVLNKGADAPGKAEYIHLERNYERVVKYDCWGHVLSDEWVTKDSPSAKVEIYPGDSRNFWSSRFTNLTTGSTACTSGSTSFRVDLTPGFCSMQVEKGVNDVEYRFYYCENSYYDPLAKTARCNLPELGEMGHLFVNIVYSESREPYPREFRPSADSCPKFP